MLHRSELLSFTWMLARGHLYKLEVEEDPLFVDLRRRGITREEFDRLDAAQRQAELEARLPAPVPVDSALDAIAREMEGGAAWSPAVRETLQAAASSWRDQRDHSGLATVHDFAARLSPCPVSFQQLVDLLGRPDDYSPSKAYYGTSDGGLVILADPRGRVESLRIT